MKEEQITARQQEILDWVKQYIAANGFPPTRQEIATAFSFGLNAAQSHLNALANHRRIDLVVGISRGIRVLP